MKEVVGDIWDFHKLGYWIVITTNGVVKKDGTNVMGRGIAEQAADKYPDLPLSLGVCIKEKGNHVFSFPDIRIITFPAKHGWYQNADLSLIQQSAKELSILRNHLLFSGEDVPIYLVRPGCGNGRLDWSEVKPILEEYLDSDFVVVDING